MEECTYATNCLIITNIPSSPLEYDQLKLKLDSFGTIIETINLPSFNRIMIIFNDTLSSKACKEYIDTQLLLLNDSPLKAYYFDLHPYTVEDSLLQVPGIERNFLLSPPGSPQSDWEQTAEAAPSFGGYHRMNHTQDVELEVGSVMKIGYQNIEEAGRSTTLFFEHELPTIVIEDVDYDSNCVFKRGELRIKDHVTSLPP